MCQLKFGDTVEVKASAEKGIIVGKAEADACFWVALESGEEAALNAEELVFRPHPDTVRLDWIIRNGAVIESADGEYILHIDEDDVGIVGDSLLVRSRIDAVMTKN